jgi:hypothetical protein
LRVICVGGVLLKTKETSSIHCQNTYKATELEVERGAALCGARGEPQTTQKHDHVNQTIHTM